MVEQVAGQVGHGWHVESQTDYQAVLIRPGTRVHHLLHVVLSVLTLGIWIPVWITIAVLKKRDKHKVVQVDGLGNVTVTRRRG
jgi:hypothetical protein